MKTTYKLIIFVFFLLLWFSCKKDEVVDNSNDNFMVNINVTNLICFPNDSISLTFLINVTNGIPPYSYNWIKPSNFVGAGPFTINVKSDVTLDLEVSDGVNSKVKYLYEIQKDTIDSLKYDYRNTYIGNYKCEVTYRWATQDSSGVFQCYDTTYQDTLSASKHAQFDMLKISNIPDVQYYSKASVFLGPHTTVTFTSDSISIYFSLTPVGLYNWTYKGKKLNK